MIYKQLAKKLAQKAGKIIKKNFGNGGLMKRDWKKDGTPVTKTDIAVNKLVISEVKKYFPRHGVLGEEASFNHNQSEFLWVCDPVDGIVPFSHSIPT